MQEPVRDKERPVPSHRMIIPISEYRVTMSYSLKLLLRVHIPFSFIAFDKSRYLLHVNIRTMVGVNEPG